MTFVFPLLLRKSTIITRQSPFRNHDGIQLPPVPVLLPAGGIAAVLLDAAAGAALAADAAELLLLRMGEPVVCGADVRLDADRLRVRSGDQRKMETAVARTLEAAGSGRTAVTGTADRPDHQHLLEPFATRVLQILQLRHRELYVVGRSGWPART